MGIRDPLLGKTVTNKCLTQIIKLCCVISKKRVQDMAVHYLTSFTYFLPAELRAGAPTLSLQHPLVSYSQHVILSSLFAISMAVCKGALGGIIIDVSGGAASAKKSKYLDLKTVCCANHAHPHCLSLSGEQVPALHG